MKDKLSPRTQAETDALINIQKTAIQPEQFKSYFKRRIDPVRIPGGVAVENPPKPYGRNKHYFFKQYQSIKN